MAHSSMSRIGCSFSLSHSIGVGNAVVSPPVVFLPNQATASSCAASSSGRSSSDVSNWASRQGLSAFRCHHPGHRGDLRSVSANSVQTRHFNMSFDPSKSNIPAEYNFVQPIVVQEPGVENAVEDLDTATVNLGPYAEIDGTSGHANDMYWKGPAPEGSFMVGNTYAQRTRLTPLYVPELGASGPRNPLARLLSPFPREEYYAVEMDHNYGKELPHFVWENGTFAFRPGFLSPSIDPDLPAYWLHTGIARFEISSTDRVLQTLISGLYIAALAALSALLYSVKPALLAAVAVSWARNTLSLAKWAGLLALCALDRMYLYWVLLAGRIIDGLLARHAPPLRNFCWANLVLWGLYLVFTPSDWPLLPGITA